ncbi:MAG TPA: flagellar motor protein MotB [Solirubrobacteraceae bacterium]|nr:flagellar motor protein MotB [Solirubrobacteraceae bacterium]
MSARRHKRGGHDHEEEHENEERWLVSFADMMTLLFCLFMVLFAISSVNTSKFEALQKALQDAFSGKILSGGEAVMQTGNQAPPEDPGTEPPLPSMTPLQALANTSVEQKASKAAEKETQDFKALKRRIDQLVEREGLTGKVQTTVRKRGLVVELLTDNVFFDSGQAVLKPPAVNLLDKLGDVLSAEKLHPIVVEGHTDSQPIATSQYPSNWELSGARASAVIRAFTADGVPRGRLSGALYGAENPTASNATAEGRSRNRRVDVILTRLHQEP